MAEERVQRRLAAILAAVGAGVFSDLHQAVDHLVRPEGTPVVADPDLRAVLRWALSELRQALSGAEAGPDLGRSRLTEEKHE